MPLVIEIPDEVLVALRLPLGKQAEELKKELAIHLYREGILSFGAARRLAGVKKIDFHFILGERHIPRHYTEEDLMEDVEVSLNIFEK